MSKSRHHSPRVEVLRDELNVFEDLLYDVSVQNTSICTYYPQHSVENKNTPIVFDVCGTDIHYVNLPETKIEIRAKLVDKAGNDIPYEADKEKTSYAMVNNSLHSMFKSVSVHIQETEITDKLGYYPYRAFPETVLGKSKDYNKSVAQASGYYRTKDESDVLDEGWKSRMTLCDRSAVFEMIGRPHLDILHQTKYLLPGLNLRFSFTRSDDQFCLHSYGSVFPGDIQLQILEAKLYITKHVILPSEQLKQLAMWEKEPIRYPMREVQMRSYTLPQGTLSHNNSSLITSLLPDRLLIGLLDSRSVHGAYSLNPFLYQDFGLSNISITSNSDVVTTQELEVDFSDKRYIRAYNQVFDALGIADCDSGVSLTMEEFTKSKTFFVFDMRHLRGAACTPRYGNITINLRFKNAITQALNVMCYLEYPACLNIDSEKNVWFTDFSNQ